MEEHINIISDIVEEKLKASLAEHKNSLLHDMERTVEKISTDVRSLRKGMLSLPEVSSKSELWSPEVDIDLKCAEKKQKRVSCSLDGKFDPAKENVMTQAKLGRTNPGHFHIKNF
ncbi:hypothetical protein DPMN_097038 [Dreissena polymorpha]|uniref:Uncharacterized protein n=1 Tax=Dreissena polymorpha TaxID=45954 RepID=A0A9D4L9J5_DREPO|nr:hypothetical protein DPMN_097038 [Dreissena polymorpha]